MPPCMDLVQYCCRNLIPNGTHLHMPLDLITDTEHRYAQIEKEALASTWACEKFASYVMGKTFEIETDHKPVVPPLGTKPPESLPQRVLRFRLRLDRFSYSIKHVPEKICTLPTPFLVHQPQLPQE